MASATVILDDDVSISGVLDHCIQSGDVTVELSGEGWWRLVEAMQDWLGECPHCGKNVGETPNPAESNAGVGAISDEGNLPPDDPDILPHTEERIR